MLHEFLATNNLSYKYMSNDSVSPVATAAFFAEAMEVAKARLLSEDMANTGLLSEEVAAPLFLPGASGGEGELLTRATIGVEVFARKKSDCRSSSADVFTLFSLVPRPGNSASG